ncbi:kinesin, putative [Bodo saltans]|uniref:Kinesin, putative n=1 Tax=Bodo saltans TaxID=75058 RepID=A0A0S4JQK2_BODSA|nr:kinesin, putative [Bodo saltans]|eukprot:CUG92623.1 kinesin, putative [Bodo saltans]
MASSPRNQNTLTVLRRKFPSVLLAVTKNDERRLALLSLTKERFVVTDCGVGHDVAQIWCHPKKFDALLVMFDETLDPTCPLVIGDIRRRELQDAKQEASEVQNLQRSRLGDGDSTPVHAHRAQRFAERQHDKQRLIDAQRMIGVVSSSTTPASAAPAPHQRTLIIGFCDASNASTKSAMDHSGQYDAVRLGKPSDAANIEFLVDLLRADYALPLPEHVPTFDEVVASLSKFRDATGHDGTASYGWDKLNNSVAASSSRMASSKLSSPLGSPLGRTIPTSANIVAPISDQWQSVLNAGISSPKAAASAQKLSMERHLREAKEKIAELMSARDSIEHDLAAAHATNQQLRSSADSIQDQLLESLDKFESLSVRYESLATELEDVKREAMIQLRQGGSAAGTFARHGPTPTLNEDVQHLVVQNNRLRQTAFEFESALHEKSLECKALQRRLKKIINGGGSTKPGQLEGRQHRHPSLCRVQLPDATELFKADVGEGSTIKIAPLFDISTIKLGAEMSSDEENDGTEDSSDSEQNDREALAPQRSVRFSKTASLIRAKSNGTLRRRSQAGDAETHLARESMERSLMAFFDYESHQDALFTGLKDWIGHPPNQLTLTPESIARPSSGNGTSQQFESNAAIISSTWAAIEQQFQESSTARRHIANDMRASVLCFGDAAPKGVVNPQLVAQALLLESCGSENAAPALSTCVDSICSDFCQFAEHTSGIHHSILQNLLASQLQFYNHMTMRLRSMVPADAMAPCRALLNAIVLHQCANLKKTLASHAVAETSTVPLARRVLSLTLAHVAAVVTPLQKQVARLSGSGTSESSTQTQADQIKPRPPARRAA